MISLSLNLNATKRKKCFEAKIPNLIAQVLSQIRYKTSNKLKYSSILIKLTQTRVRKTSAQA